RHNTSLGHFNPTSAAENFFLGLVGLYLLWIASVTNRVLEIARVPVAVSASSAPRVVKSLRRFSFWLRPLLPD
ncbi:MAG: hypothetical protein ACKVQK_15290, partial [Burkholderiales bacterium]